MANELITFTVPKLGSLAPNLGTSFNSTEMAFPVDSLSQALANIPAAGVGNGSNLPQALSQTSTLTKTFEQRLKELGDLKEKGTITEADYATAKETSTIQFKRSLGIESPEQQVPQDPSASLSGKVLEAAQKSNTGAYAVTEQHSAIASQCVEAAKKILSKENPSEAELQQIEEIFNKLNQNPMLAEAFVTEANQTTLPTSSSSNTITLLGRYQEILTKTQGITAAKEKTDEINSKFAKNVQGRNSKAYELFNQKYENGSEAVNENYGTVDRWMHKASKHPIAASIAAGVPAIAAGVFVGKAVAAAGAVAAGTATGGAMAAIGGFLLAAAPVALGVVAVAGLLYCGYKIATEKD